MSIIFKESYAMGTYNLITGSVNIEYLDGKLYDTGYGLYISMIDSNGVVVAPTEETMILYATRPDNTKVYFVAEYDGNKMRFDFNNSMYEVRGNVSCELQIIDSSGLRKTSSTFFVNAEDMVFDPSYVKSSDDFRVLREALDEVKTVSEMLEGISRERIDYVNSNEDLRISNESIRNNSETVRVNNESNRVSSELTRKENETIRGSNEDLRISNESIRVSQEDIRQEFYSGFHERLDFFENELKVDIDGGMFRDVRPVENTIDGGTF